MTCAEFPPARARIDNGRKTCDSTIGLNIVMIDEINNRLHWLLLQQKVRNQEENWELKRRSQMSLIL